MFGIGLVEIFVILIVAVLVIGPQQLPDAARSIGKFVRLTRQFMHDVKNGLYLDEQHGAQTPLKDSDGFKAPDRKEQD